MKQYLRVNMNQRSLALAMPVQLIKRFLLGGAADVSSTNKS